MSTAVGMFQDLDGCSVACERIVLVGVVAIQTVGPQDSLRRNVQAEQDFQLCMQHIQTLAAMALNLKQQNQT